MGNRVVTRVGGEREDEALRGRWARGEGPRHPHGTEGRRSSETPLPLPLSLLFLRLASPLPSPPRQVRSQYEAARAAEMVQQAEEGAAEVAVRKEVLATSLTVEDHLLRVSGEGER